MKNILLLSTIYPAPDLKYGTPSIHYFTKEWAKIGYRVRVIHSQAVYPAILYLFAKLFRDIIVSYTGAVVFTSREANDKSYRMDNVDIHRLPLFKWFPHRKFTKNRISLQIRKIILINKESGFVPDIIIGHFSNPQLEIINDLKKEYHVETCIVMHDDGKNIKKIYNDNYLELMKNIDYWGYRSKAIQKGFEDNYGKQKETFLCYSGIPEDYITRVNKKQFSGSLKMFIYVGEFIKRKHPIAVATAINQVYPKDSDYKLVYVGRGAEKKKLKKIVELLKIEDHVIFLGHLKRNEVQDILDKSECFIMISEGEAFGLVYLEAMARGCITIGSKNEGIDGVIQHGINGYLCESGNENELANIFRSINSLSQSERKAISQNAVATANKMTDHIVAKEYLKSLKI